MSKRPITLQGVASFLGRMLAASATVAFLGSSSCHYHACSHFHHDDGHHDGCGHHHHHDDGHDPGDPGPGERAPPQVRDGGGLGGAAGIR